MWVVRNTVTETELNQQTQYTLWVKKTEENVIYAQFGKDLFNVSKVIGRKKWPSFFWLTVYITSANEVFHIQLITDGIFDH